MARCVSVRVRARPRNAHEPPCSSHLYERTSGRVPRGVLNNQSTTFAESSNYILIKSAGAAGLR